MPRSPFPLPPHTVPGPGLDLGSLTEVLQEIDGLGYAAYERIRGVWRFPGFILDVIRVQRDPFAPPSRLRVFVPPDIAGLDQALLRSRTRAIGTAAALARAFADRARKVSTRTGSGNSGTLRMECPGQEVLPITAIRIDGPGGIEARFGAGLPARGRRIAGGAAIRLLTETLPGLVQDTLHARSHPPGHLLRHAEVNEDADALREALAPRGWVAFVGDGAVLPRRSGVDDGPLDGALAVPFTSPDRLRREVTLPNRGTVSGLAIPRGVTLVVGGGFHGKSTLLRALAQGVYNHRPGDGREFVVTEPSAMKVRAEDGRSVAGVDISPFIGALPGGNDPRRFTSLNASGSTSQAAAIMEAIEAGARTLLVDEDTTATNFMIRDRRMQALVPGEREPITSFVDRVRDLLRERGVSTLLVVGGSGDYLEEADTVLAMDGFRPEDVTAEAREVVTRFPSGRLRESGPPFGTPMARRPIAGSIELRGRGGRPRLRVHDRHTLVLGEQTLSLEALDALVAPAQLRAIGQAIVLATERFMVPPRDLVHVLDAVMDRVATAGLDGLAPETDGGLAGFRRLELAAVLNRIRGMRLAPETRGEGASDAPAPEPALEGELLGPPRDLTPNAPPTADPAGGSP